MKKKTLNKGIYKALTSSIGRFLCIVILMLLGSFGLVGLKVVGPNMRATGNHYFEKYNMADHYLITDYGIDDTDIDIIESMDSINQVEYGYLKDVMITDTKTSLRIFSDTKDISKFEIVDGMLPTADNQIAISDVYKEQYPIGSFLNISEEEDLSGNKNLKYDSYEVVGFVRTTEFLSTLNLGPTTVGTGDLKGFGVVTSDSFNSDVYMIARIVYKDTKVLNPYSSKYKDAVLEHKLELGELLEEQPEKRFVDIKEAYESKIDEGYEKINDAKAKLEDARIKLEDAKIKLEDADKEIKENELKLEDGKKELEDGETKLSDGYALYNAKLKEFNTQEKLYKDSKAELEVNAIKLTAAKEELDEKAAQLEHGKKQYDDGLKELETNIVMLESAIDNSQSAEEKSSYVATFDSVKGQYAVVLGEYTKFIEGVYLPSKSQLENASKQLNTKQLELEAGKNKISDASKKIESARVQLSNSKKTLDSSKIKLENGNKELKDNTLRLEDAKVNYSEGYDEYTSKKAEYDEKKLEADDEISENEIKLQDAQSTLDELANPVYNIYNRGEMHGGEGYKRYESISIIIDSLANIFPIFLYFVAALVTFTTMTRFVDDERINSGILKALGYTDNDIIKKFTLYGLISSAIGTLLGIILGHTLLPYIAYMAYGDGFSLPRMELHFNIWITIAAVILGFISAVLPAFIVAKKELGEKPAKLLQAKPPVSGSKILLEHIAFIWNRLSFTHKVTARNIFRYKKRMFMTIFGVCGSVALLFTGLSVQGSVKGINERQFNDLITYDLIVSYDNKKSEKDMSELQQVLNNDKIESYTSIYYEELKVQAGENIQSIKLLVPEKEDEFNEFMQLFERKSGKHLELNENDSIVSERLAKLLNISDGDVIQVKDSNNSDVNLTISNDAEMYLGHFVFMSKDNYEKQFNRDYQSNAYVAKLFDNTINNTEEMAMNFISCNNVNGVVQNTILKTHINVIVDSLDMIMKILIFLAILLGVVILYNLTNINVVERIRELSTIKVLGFYDKEVTMYIYRETILLSILGIFVGYGFGILLHSYILTNVPPEDTMFNPAIVTSSYIIPAILILITNVVIGIFMNHKLKKIDMLEALKSVE